MKGTTTALLCLLGILAGGSSASAATETTTVGRVCCPHTAGQLENFGGYTFKGMTTPSLTGQFVYFQYKRPWWDRWRLFKVEPEGLGFYVLNRDAARDAINDRDRWRILFTPNVRPGYWKIRAVFPAQDGYARSKVTKRFLVRPSD